ncbi:hypothetical protein M0R45_032503 [Rubus argutus]|uniref:Protein kinase domain-containing protein n=1 Tax=Rubus argutus TaxID=59490 RepID=A0AAW1WJZ9_RUBAR
MVPVGLLLHIITVLLWSMNTTSTLVLASEAVPLTKYSNCTSQCGDVKIPYPFGIEAGCYIDEWFHILCSNITVNTNETRLFPFLNHANLNLEVLNISVEGTVQVRYNYSFSHSICADQPSTCQPANLSGSPFVYSQKNRFAAMGCSGITWMRFSNGSAICGCLSICGGAVLPFDKLDSCNGINCCQTNIPPELTAFNYSFEALPNKTTPGTENFKYAFLVDPDSFFYHSTGLRSLRSMYIPFLLDWKLNHYSTVQIYGTDDWTADLITTNCTSTTQCFCSQGYQGNPYLIDGCQDINECEEHPNICGNDTSVLCYNLKGPEGLYGCLFPSPPGPSRVNVPIVVISCVVGFLFLHIGGWWSHKVIKKRKNIKRKQKFFKQNGGLLLQQQSSSYETGVETIKLFNSEELEKATNNFNADRILGRGGQGTVYKGMLADGKIIAVKKSLLANEDEVRQFINEIVILSQIIHRNVVKLLGCCLETEVPLLVYEFISNGTLSHYIQHENEDFPLTWGIRLRVAIEVAEALSYLHSSASAPIYHRDIKSSNILLDDKYRIKVADFGTSRSVPIDKTHLTMSQVQGTFGYLDPEYFQTSQFTDKSDVYSFGVVLAELLTGKKTDFSDHVRRSHQPVKFLPCIHGGESSV